MAKKSKPRGIQKYQNKIVAHIEALAGMTAGQLSNNNHGPVKFLMQDVLFLLEAIEKHFEPEPKKDSANADKNKDS